MKNIRSRIQLNNRGSSIVTVLVVCTFITIIATTLLYITGKNYISKQTDYQNKTSFYQAEEALDMLKAYLADDVSEAFTEAYAETLANYIDHSGAASLDSYYAQAYTEKLEDMWNTRKGSGTWTEALQAYFTDKLTEYGEDTSIAQRIISMDGIQTPPAKDKIILVGVRVAYEPDEGYSTYIYTDIGLELPSLYLTAMTDGDTNQAGETIDVADCVKYMNWQRYDEEESTTTTE